jgi:hypothetical protein
MPALSAQIISLQPATPMQLPAPTDSNSPGHWSNGSFVVFNAMGYPLRSEGADQFSLGNSTEVSLGRGYPSPMWIEATWMDDDGTLFAWYHHEPGGVCSRSNLTAPKIGAMVSYDNGYSFRDLGFILESGDPVDCGSQNGYFAGGNGDFSVMVDATRSYIYFLYSNYGGPIWNQGVAIARMNFADRFSPKGAVRKFYNGDFSEPGIFGRVTPMFSANVSWASANTDAFWGPSIHWNTAINQYVMLLNRSCCSPGWPQEGIYISLNPDIGDPTGWSAPVKLLDSDGWYPQVIGEDPGGTDKVAGAVSRLYVYGHSDYELVITNLDQPTESEHTITVKRALQIPSTH